jgi:type I restriction enzyme S subunit
MANTKTTEVATNVWTVQPLEDVVDILDSRRVPINSKERETRQGSVPYYGATGQVGWIDDFLFDEELVLLGEDGAPFLDPYKQKAYLVRGKSWVNNHAHVLRARSGIPNAYIKYFLDQLDFSPFVSGTTRLKLTQASMRQIQVPIAPLGQRESIVSEIEKQFSRLDEAVTAMKRIQANLKRYKAAVLKAAVEGKLTEQWRKEHPDVEPADQLLKRILAERRAKWEAEELAKMKAKGIKSKDDSWKKKYKEPVGPDTANLPELPELPEGWVWARAEQLSDFITKGTTPSADKLHDGNGDIRFLKVYNLTFSGRLNYDYKASFIDQSVHQGELARSKVLSGDILINIVGPPLGQVSIVPDEIQEANINQAIARFRPLNGVFNRFLALALMTNSVMSWAIKRAKTTAGQSNLTLELCRELPIPLPSLVEQSQIVSETDLRLSVTEELEATIETNLKRAERLRQTILQLAFSVGLVENQSA